MNEKPTVLDLFSGIGGFSIAFAAEGFRTVGFCEKEPWAQQCLIEKFSARQIASGFLLRLRQAGKSLGIMFNTSDEIKKEWQSLSEENRAWVFRATFLGTFHAEWPGVPRVAEGIKGRSHRLKGLGNAIVPQVAQIFARAIYAALT